MLSGKQTILPQPIRSPTLLLFSLFKPLPFLLHTQSVDALASYFKGGTTRREYVEAPTCAHSRPIPHQPRVSLSQALLVLSLPFPSHVLKDSTRATLLSSPLDCCYQQVNMLLILPLKKQKTRKPSRFYFPLHLPPITLFQSTAKLFKRPAHTAFIPLLPCDCPHYYEKFQPYKSVEIVIRTSV